MAELDNHYCMENPELKPIVEIGLNEIGLNETNTNERTTEQEKPASPRPISVDDLSVPVKMRNALDEASIYMQHKDPFVLREDVCANPDCKTKPMKHRIPCLRCCGATHYCSEDCMWDHYPQHNFPCKKVFKSILDSDHSLGKQRERQLGPSRGCTELLRHIIKDLDRDTLFQNLFFIRLPVNTQTKITLDHPVKQLSRTGCAPILIHNICFQAAWKAFTRHLRSTKEGDAPYIYFFTYPPDLSFTFMTAIPFEEQEHFDEALQPVLELIPCPCMVHSRTD